MDELVRVLTSWRPAPSTLVPVLTLGVVYAAGVRAQSRAGAAVVGGQVTAFVAAELALLLALASPLDDLAELLFAAHMVQHLLLVLAAAPLLLLARTHLAVARVVPVTTRRRAARIARRMVERIGPAGIVSITVTHVVTVLSWHVPTLYDLAVRNLGVHLLEHATLLTTALLFWAAFGVGRPRPVAAAAIVSFVAALSMGLLAALMSFADSPWYAVHLGRSELLGVPALTDQRLAAAIMWIPGGIVYLLATAIGVVRWISDDERRVTAAAPRA